MDEFLFYIQNCVDMFKKSYKLYDMMENIFISLTLKNAAENARSISCKLWVIPTNTT